MHTDPPVARIMEYVDGNIDSLRDASSIDDVSIFDLIFAPVMAPTMEVYRAGEAIATIYLDRSEDPYQQLHVAGSMFGADRIVYGIDAFTCDDPINPATNQPWTQNQLHADYRGGRRDEISEMLVITDIDDDNATKITVAPFDRSDPTIVMWDDPQPYEYRDRGVWMHNGPAGPQRRLPPYGAVDVDLLDVIRQTLRRPSDIREKVEASAPRKPPHPGPDGWFTDVLLAHYLFSNSGMYVLLAERGRKHANALNKVGVHQRMQMG